MRGLFAIFALSLCLLSGCFIYPEPLTEEEHLARFLGDKAELDSLRNAPDAPISLEEAIARTIKYNLDNRLIQMEAAFSRDTLASTTLQMLPKLALNAGYSIRNKESASRSISYYKRTETLEPSVSSELDRYNGDLSFSWSLLDFGLSYFQAKQQADRVLIMMERRRRVMNNLVKDVLSAYYLYASLERIRPEVEQALVNAREALDAYRRMEQSPTAPVAEALERQKAVIMVIAQLRQMHTDMALARSRLAALMNIPPDVDFTIQPVDGTGFVPPELSVQLDRLEDIGVFLRPDLREESYLERIDRREVKKEMLRMFPGLTAFGNLNYDSNRFITNNFWAEAGGKFTMDILGLAQRSRQYKAAKTQVEVAKTRRLASTVAAIVQIDMSYHQYQSAIEHFNDSREINRINTRLSDLTAASAKTRTIGRMDALMQGVSDVNSRLDMDRRMIDVLSAWANLYFSVGCDVLLEVAGDEPLPELTAKARAGLERWLSGQIPDLPHRPEFGGVCLASSGALPAAVAPVRRDAPLMTVTRQAESVIVAPDILVQPDESFAVLKPYAQVIPPGTPNAAALPLVPVAIDSAGAL